MSLVSPVQKPQRKDRLYSPDQEFIPVQAVSMFKGQSLFDRPMHIKMDERALPKGDFFPPEHPQQLPHGLVGTGIGLGIGGQPIHANHLKKGLGMGNRACRHGGHLGGCMENMRLFGSGMNMGPISEILNNTLKMGGNHWKAGRRGKWRQHP